MIAKRVYRKPEYQLSGGAVIFHLSNNVINYLLLKYPTYWGFMKGKVLPGEDEELSIFRETIEETGLEDISIIPGFREVSKLFFKSWEDANRLIKKDAVFFLAQTHKWDVRISHEHENFKWCTYNEALQLIKVKGVRNLITKAHNFLKNYYKEKNNIEIR